MLILHEIGRSSVGWVIIEKNIQLSLLSFIVMLVCLSLPHYNLHILDWVVVELDETRWNFIRIYKIRFFLVELVLFCLVRMLDSLRLFPEIFQLCLNGFIWFVCLQCVLLLLYSFLKIESKFFIRVDKTVGDAAVIIIEVLIGRTSLISVSEVVCLDWAHLD